MENQAEKKSKQPAAKSPKQRKGSQIATGSETRDILPRMSYFKLMHSSFDYKIIESADKSETYRHYELSATILDTEMDDIAILFKMSASKRYEEENLVNIECQYLALIDAAEGAPNVDDIAREYGRMTAWPKFMNYFNWINSEANLQLPPLPYSPDQISVNRFQIPPQDRGAK